MIRFKSSVETIVTPNLIEFVRRPFVLWLRAILAYKRGIPPMWANAKLQKRDPKLKHWLDISDVIIFDFPYTFFEIGQMSRPLILNSHNVEARLFSQEAKTGSKIAAQIRDLELSAISRVNFVLCASHEELDYFSKENPNQQLLHIPNCIKVIQNTGDKSEANEQLRRSLGIGNSERVLLFPASRYGPNEDGAAFLQQFCLDHDDLLRDQKIVMLVAGSVTPKSDRNGQFIATGPVPSIEPYFHLANWGINPIFHGSGTSIKVAEFIGFQLPILTTTIGARGFKLENDLSALFFTRENLREKIVNLPTDPETLSSMCRRSREANLSFLDPATAIRPLLEVIGKVCRPS